VVVIPLNINNVELNAMFTNDITLAGDAGSSTVYALISVEGGNSARRDGASGLDLPKDMLIKHERVTKKTLTSDRHLVRLEKTKPESVSLLPVTASVHVVLDVPRGTITVAEIKDMVTQLKNFLSAGNIDKLINNEP
jgi:hypothetical protein